MTTNNKLIEMLNQEYGITIETEEVNSNNEYIKLSKDDCAKINALFQNVPYLLKEANNANFYAGSYKVIYNKGIGTLQKAKNSNYFRANVVAPGTNNNIVDQALLQELNTTDIMKLSNVVMAAFSIASIATNQYFLARIDSKLEIVEKKVNEIQRFLEIDKESQLWADGEFLKEINNNLPYIINNDLYCQATIINVQSIRKNSLANIKLFYEQLQDLKQLLNTNDNTKETMEKINKYKGYLPKYWYSVYLYEMAYYLEVCLSKITDSFFLQRVIDEMEKIVNMYQEGYNLINNEISKYIDEVKALKANEVPAKIMKNAGKLLEIVNVPSGLLMMASIKGVGIILDKGGEALEKHEKATKKAKKQEVIEGLESLIKPYSDFELLRVQSTSVQKLNYIYNEHIEIIISDEDAYIKSF